MHPFTAGEHLRTWRRAHRDLVVRQDLRDLTRIRELGLIESMLVRLPERIASPLSINALATELGVAFTRQRREVDFLTVDGRRQWLLAEMSALRAIVRPDAPS